MAERLIFLGTGTGVPDGQRLPSSLLLWTGPGSWLVDLGPGVLRAAVRHLTLPGIRRILISHFHLDHTADLAALFFALKNAPHRPPSLLLVGPPGFQAFLDRLLAAFGLSSEIPGITVQVGELRPGEILETEIPVQAFATNHTPESQGYRFYLPGFSVAYTGDTGYHPDLIPPLLGVDLLITEVSFLQPAPGHLTPEDAAHLALETGARRLAVVHSYPGQSREMLRQRLQALLPEGYPVDLPEDGTVWNLADLKGSGA